MKYKIIAGRFFLFLSLIIFSASCNKKKEAMFESLSFSQTKVTFNNKLASHSLFNILYYLYYYNGGGVATGDINNDGLPDIYFTANNKSGNKLYLNKGNFVFEDITASAGVAGTSDWCTGVTMADVNGDGMLDIYVSTISKKYDLKGHNELFINKGNNKFSEESEKYGLNTSCLTTQSAFFDYDHDGDLDCYILNQSHHPHANIVDTASRRFYDEISGDRLYRNDISTTGKFTDVSKEAQIYQSNLGYGLGLAIADINMDGWDDIYVGNDFHENDYYYINNGNGTFTESGADHFKHYSRFSMGNDVADYNNDGQPDIVTVDMLPPDEKTLKTYGSDENPDIYKVKLDLRGYQKQYSKNCLQRNNGKGKNFSETSLMSGVSATDWSWAPLFADFDNDGKKDLFISSGIVKRPVDLDYIRFVSDLDMNKGRQSTDQYDQQAIDAMPDGSSHPYFFRNKGDFMFENVSENWGTADMKGYFTGASYADLDNDGNLDVVINPINAEAVILKNKAPFKRMMNISFKGSDKNKFGLGTKVWLYAGGQLQYQELMTTRGFQSSCEPKMHFGLDTLKYIDSMLVVWPDLKYQKMKFIPAVGHLEIRQTEAGGKFNYDSAFTEKTEIYPNQTLQTGISWSHHENDFLDYNKQYLIPHQLSTRGPKLAVGDINNDGLDDIYVCGASGQAGQLLVQTNAGAFIAHDAAVFSPFLVNEDVDAVFFDANNDGYKDLYVVSGGNEYDDGNPALADRLFLNDQKGHLQYVPNNIPKVLKNKSCVSIADVDKDGDTDLFVGGLADATQYGIAQPSYLFINNGSGVFSTASSSIINLNVTGMVTCSSFTDINNDNWPDLIVSGEWMPIKIFINKNGTFKPMEVPHSTGLWQSMLITDINKDGNPDILAGNWGKNSKLFAGKNGPLKLYVKDFDKNGSLEQIIAYTINGEEFTFLAKDELERSLPVLKKAYLHYDEVAGKTVQYMFYDLFKDYTELKAENLKSSVLLGDGKGGFIIKDLPDDLQLAPIFTFSLLDNGNIFTGGNFYGVIPYEGRYDALQPTVFDFQNQAIQIKTTLPSADGEIRDAKVVRSKNDKRQLVVARNNSSLLFYGLN